MVAGSLRIVFFGTPQFAVPTLDALTQSRHDVCGVVTQPEVDTRSTAPKTRAPLGILTLPRIEP